MHAARHGSCQLRGLQRPVSDIITYCNVNFPEEGSADALRMSRQPLDQWSMIFQLQNVPYRRVELAARLKWLLLLDKVNKEVDVSTIDSEACLPPSPYLAHSLGEILS